MAKNVMTAQVRLKTGAESSGHWAGDQWQALMNKGKFSQRRSYMNKAYTAADAHPIYVRAFNSGDIESTVACYESSGCFVAKSGRVARGTEELREVYRITFGSKPTIKVDIGEIICAGEDLALVIGQWESTAQTPVGETNAWSGTYIDIVRKQPDGTWKLVLDNPNGVDVRAKQSA